MLLYVIPYSQLFLVDEFKCPMKLNLPLLLYVKALKKGITVH